MVPIQEYFNISQKGDLGEGSFGTVSTGYYQGIPVAIKELQKPYIGSDATWREFLLLSQLRHPHIVPIIAIVTVPLPHAPFQNEYARAISHFVFPLYEKNTLLDYARYDLPYDSYQLATWFIQLADALKEIHARNMIHLDIKSNNLLVTPNKDLLLADFGLASKPRQVRKAESVGTFYLQAPESYPIPDSDFRYIRRPNTLSPHMDIYSFGISLWMMAAKLNKFPDENVLTLNMFDIYSGIVRPELPANPSPVMSIFYRVASACWSSTRSKRPSLEEIINQLNEVFQYPPETVLKTHLRPLYRYNQAF